MPDNIVYKVIPTEPFESVPSRCIAKQKDVKDEVIMLMREKDYLSVKDKCKVVEKVEPIEPKTKKMSAKPLNKMVSKTENKGVEYNMIPHEKQREPDNTGCE